MLQWFGAILEGASFFGVFRLLSTLSTTEIVFIFLCSKPIFILAAFLAGFRARLDTEKRRPELEPGN